MGDGQHEVGMGGAVAKGDKGNGIGYFPAPSLFSLPLLSMWQWENEFKMALQ